MKLLRTHEVLGLPLRIPMRCSNCGRFGMCEIFARYRWEPLALCVRCVRLP
jgi:hypothetical protein